MDLTAVLNRDRLFFVKRIVFWRVSRKNDAHQNRKKRFFPPFAKKIANFFDFVVIFGGLIRIFNDYEKHKTYFFDRKT